MFKAADIGLDLGNSQFSICVKGQGIVASESAFIAYRGDELTEASLIAFGDAAKAMNEKNPLGIKVITPMRSGVVVNCKAASLILKHLAKKAGISRSLVKPKIVVGALFGSTGIERKSFADVAESLGRQKPFIVYEPLAAAVGSNLDINEYYANLLLDIGDGATEAIITAQRQIVTGKSIRVGGSDVEDSLVKYIRKHYGLIISKSQALTIKESVGGSFDSICEKTFIPVKGIEVNGMLPTERQIPMSGIFNVLEIFAERISGFVLTLLNQVPPEVSVDLIENGIFVCGGGGQLLVVRRKIAEATGLNVTLVEKPSQSVIRGIEKMLDFSKYYM
jgi:rod shape-determining protein MreB